MGNIRGKENPASYFCEEEIMAKKLAAQILLMFLALLIAEPRLAFAAKFHSLVVSVSYGRVVYKRKFRISEGHQFSYVGSVGTKGMIFNALIDRNRSNKKLICLEYQLEVSPGKMKSGRSIQAQSEIYMRPQERLTVLECGPWSVEFSLDVVGNKRRKEGKVKRKHFGVSNYRISTKLIAGMKRRSCRFLSALGIQSSIVDTVFQTRAVETFTRRGVVRANRKFIFSVLFERVKKSGNFRLKYQLEDSLDFSPTPLQLISEEVLKLNKRRVIKAEEYNLEFLVEGKFLKRKKSKAKSEDKYGTVRFLR